MSHSFLINIMWYCRRYIFSTFLCYYSELYNINCCQSSLIIRDCLHEEMEWNLKWLLCVERDVACLHSPHSHTFNSHSPVISSLQTKHIRDTDQSWLKVIKHFIAISSRAATSLLSISPIHLSSFPLAAAHLTNCPNNQIWVLKFTNHNWKQLQSVSCDSYKSSL